MASFESRLDEFADRFAERVIERLTQGLSQFASGGGVLPAHPPSSGGALPADMRSGGGGGGPGGGGGRPSISTGNPVADAGLAFLNGAGEGIRSTPAGALGSPRAVAQRAAISGTGKLLDATIGKIPVVGDYAMAQFHSYEEAVLGPANQAEKKMGQFFADLEGMGRGTSEADMDRMSKWALTRERKSLQGRRRWERHVEDLNAQDGLSWGFNQLGF